jgi:hypothetical protein
VFGGEVFWGAELFGLIVAYISSTSRRRRENEW